MHKRLGVMVMIGLIVLAFPARVTGAQEECAVAYYRCVVEKIEAAVRGEECLVDYHACIRRRTAEA